MSKINLALEYTESLLKEASSHNLPLSLREAILNGYSAGFENGLKLALDAIYNEGLITEMSRINFLNKIGEERT